MSAPFDLATIKADLGIAADDTTNDAWLNRRMDGIWSRFESYTGRSLGLAAPWIDDWGALVTNHPADTEPPLWRACESASVYLRVFPVQAITSILMNGAPVDVARVIYEPATGKLIGLDMARDLRTELVGARALISYNAGFAEVPLDLYEAMLGVLGPLWGARQAQAVGGFPGMATRIATTDVGEVEFSSAPNVFVDAAQRGVRVTDPLLGPYGMLLDPYVDWRSLIGGAYPTTVSGWGTTAVVQSTPPVNAADNTLWWNSDAGPGGGQLYIYYNDGNTRQWVPTSAKAAGPAASP